MKNKFKKIKAYYFILLILLIFSKIPVMNIEAEGNISDIFIKEYNMSVLSVDQNNQSLSIITAVKITNKNEDIFVPNFNDVAQTGMNFIRFSLPEGFFDLYVETDLPSGNLIEIPQGFALTSEVPSGDSNIIFSYYINYDSSKFEFPLHFPHGTDTFKIIVPEGSGKISGERLSFDKKVDISEKTFDEYIGNNYAKGEYLNMEMTNIPTSFVNKLSSSLNFQVINLVVIILMVNVIIIFFILRYFKITVKKMQPINIRNISVIATFLFFISFFVFLIFGTISDKAPKIQNGVNTTMGEVSVSAPNGTKFEVINLNGQTIKLDDFAGKPLVIDFWSSWCGPCIKEAKVLSDGYKEWNFRGVEFVGIAIWDEIDSIENFIKNNDIQYEILIDKEGYTAVNFGVIAVPEKFFVKSDGTFAFKINGPLDTKSLDDYIARLLEEDKR